MEKAGTRTNTDANLEERSLSYKLLLSCRYGVSPQQLTVAFGEAYDRIPHPDLSLERSIDEIWEQRVQGNPSLYNGKKFRYGGYTFHDNGAPNMPSVCLQLGLTDYRTFVGTNLSPSWERFLIPSEDDYIRCQHTSSPLGNGAVVETLDKKIVVLRRSNNVGEFPRHFVFPGGHPEPEEVGITTTYRCGNQVADLEQVNMMVSQEMFDSIIREVIEETGVTASSLSNPLFIGISRRELNVRPTAFFFISCSLRSEEIQQLYSTAEDGYESTQLYTVSMDEVEKMSSKMPGCHRGGFALYKLMAEAVSNT